MKEFNLPCKGCGIPTPGISIPVADEVIRQPQFCPECKASMFGGPPEIPAKPECEQIERICVTCHQPFPGAKLTLLGRSFEYGNFCEPCTRKQQARHVDPTDLEFIAARKAEWETICPEFYRTDAIAKAMPVEKVARVKALLAKGGGISLYGASGAFKTTAILHGAVKTLIWQRKKVIFVAAFQWKPRMSKAAKECDVEAAVAQYAKVPWLFLDDVGNMAGTPASEEALHLLMELRMRDNLPMLTTTQFTGEQLVAKFSSPELGAAIVRRMNLMTGDPVKFK